MAETLISPGVLSRENDQSQITAQPIQAGAALIGPTVLGKPGIPTLVTTYSEYLATFGSTFLSGSDDYSFLTSDAAFNYFQNAGTSLLVTRVTSGSFSPASSSAVASQTGSLPNAFTLETLGRNRGYIKKEDQAPVRLSTTTVNTGIDLAKLSSEQLKNLSDIMQEQKDDKPHMIDITAETVIP